MKKILIPVSNSFFVRNFLRAGFIAELKNNFEIIFLAPKEKISYYIEQFGTVGVKWEVLPTSDTLQSDNLFKKIEAWSIHSRFVYLNHWYFLKRLETKDNWLRRFSLFPFRLLLWQLGRFVWWRRLVRFGYAKLRSKNFEQILEKYRPDIVFAPSINLGSEWAIIRVAKRLGIKTIGMTPSWDNFYTKTFLRVFPDFLFVQTNLMKEQATRLADYPASRVLVTGLPQYDYLFRKIGLKKRDEFVRELGGEPDKKLILFACSGKVTLALDFEMIGILNDILESKNLKATTQVLVRPHPKRAFSDSQIKMIKDKYGFLIHTPVAKLANVKDPYEFDQKSLGLLLNSLVNSDIVIATCTTFFIEAAIFGRPLIAIGFDGHSGINYWNSARRFGEWDHLADLFKTGGVWQVQSETDFDRAINSYLKDSGLHQDGRGRIISEQVVFTDANSTHRIAELLTRLADYPLAVRF